MTATIVFNDWTLLCVSHRFNITDEELFRQKFGSTISTRFTMTECLLWLLAGRVTEYDTPLIDTLR